MRDWLPDRRGVYDSPRLVPQLPAATCPPQQVDTTPPAPAAQPLAPDLDEAGIIEKSHAYHDAFDRFDADAIAGFLSPSFSFYSEARFATDILTGLRAQAAAEKQTGPGGFMTGELAAAFKDGYKVLRDEVVEDKPDCGMRPVMKIVRFVAQKL